MLKRLISLKKNITVFDVVLLTVICVLGIGFFLFFYRTSTYVNITVRVTDQDVLYAQTQPQNWYANRFAIGDVERDSVGNVIAEIIDVHVTPVESNRSIVYITLRVKSVYDSRTKLYSLRGKPIIFGNAFRFTMQNVVFDGIVTKAPKSSEAGIEKNIRITALMRGIEPYVAEALKKDMMVKSSTGTILAKILDVNIKPAEVVTQNLYGDLLLKNDPLYKDVIVSVEVLSLLENDVYYAFDKPIAVGEPIALNFGHISIYPFITSIEPL
jgi:hypothetical protein